MPATVTNVLTTDTWTAYELETVADADKVSRELRNFIGKDLKAVTVLAFK